MWEKIMSIDGDLINILIANIWLHLMLKFGNAQISQCFCQISLFAFIDVFKIQQKDRPK